MLLSFKTFIILKKDRNSLKNNVLINLCDLINKLNS